MNYDYDIFEDLYEEESPEGRPRDVKIDEARASLEKFFNQQDREVFHGKQVEVLFEKTFFHWITSKALDEMVKEGKIIGSEEMPLLGKTRVKFVFNKKYRDRKLEMRDHLRVVRGYSTPPLPGDCGRQAEIMFEKCFGW